jgi:amicyanin
MNNINQRTTTMKALSQHRGKKMLLALVVVGAFGGVGVALAAGGSGGAAMATHTAPAAQKRAATPPTTTPVMRTTPAAPAPAGPAPAANPAPASTVAVRIVNFKFTPATMTIKAGTAVTWTNKDAVGHTVNFHANGINSSVLNQGDTFSHTFSTPGTYAYICDIHPFMHGTIVVTA